MAKILDFKKKVKPFDKINMNFSSELGDVAAFKRKQANSLNKNIIKSNGTIESTLQI